MSGPPFLLELAALLPLSLAAGLDLYLTLVFLGLSPHLGWDPPPGSLEILGAPAVVAMSTGLWVVEAWMDRHPPLALFWNVAHTIVRPLAAALLALLLLEAAGLGWSAVGAVVAAAAAFGSHAARTGWDLLLWIGQAGRRIRLVASLAADVIVLALATLVVDQPGTGAVLAAAMLVLGWLGMGPYLRAATFGHRMVWGRTWGTLSPRRWRGHTDFPRWLRRALQDDDEAPAGAVRGAPGGGLWLPGQRIFHTGWVVVRGGSPLFLYRRGRRSVRLDLAGTPPVRVVRDGLHNRVELRGADGSPCALYFPKDGPRPESLEAEFPT